MLYFLSSLEQGGAERQAAELVRGLDRAKYEAHLAICNPTDQLGYALPFASRTNLEAPMGPEPRTLHRLKRLIADLRPDIVHSYLGHPNIYARIAVHETGIGKAIGSVRCTQLPAAYVPAERGTNLWSDALIVNSAAIRNELETRARIARGRIDVIENGVDTARFRPLSDEERDEARTRFAMTPLTVVVPGRISAQKNQIAVVRALWRLKRKRALPADVRVLFAGREEAHTRYGTFLRAAIALTGAGGVTRFLGVVRDVERLLGAADAVLLPSRFEGLPNVVLESLACGTPALVSPSANADHLVEDGVSGLCLEDDGPRAIETALERFFAASPEKRRAWGEAGRRSVVARFTLERMVDRTSAVYQRVLAT